MFWFNNRKVNSQVGQKLSYQNITFAKNLKRHDQERKMPLDNRHAAANA